jgi:hypothetical protein
LHTAIQSSDFNRRHPNLASFVVAVIAGINGRTMNDSLSVLTSDAATEYAWQAEFYRSASRLLPQGCDISPEVGLVFAVDGRVDFFINRLNWGVELLVESKAVDEHLDRFGALGAYAGIPFSENLTINFTSRANMERGLPLRDRYWIVVYDDDFKGASLHLLSGGKKEERRIEFLGI